MTRTEGTVLLLAMALDLGGAETHVVSLARGLAQRGWRPHVVSAGGRLVDQLQTAGVPHTEAPLDSRSPAQILRALKVVRQTIVRIRPDVLHAHARIPAWVADRARRGRHLPLVTTYHGIYNAGWFWRLVSRWGDAAIAVSPEVRQHLVERLGAPANHVRVIPNGVDTDHFVPAAASEAAETAVRPLLVHLGRLDDVLDPAFAVCDAAAALAPAWPQLGAIIVGGGTGAAAVAARAEAANRRAGREVVRLAGTLPDPRPYLQRADAVVAAGRAALEGLACGRPLLAVGAGGIGGWVTPDTWEALAARNFSGRGSGRPATGDNLAAACLEMLDQPDEMVRLGHFGRELALDRFSTEGMVGSVINVYRAVQPASTAGTDQTDREDAR